MDNEVEIAAVGLTEEEMIEVVREIEQRKGTTSQMKSNEPDKKDREDPRPSPPQPQPAPRPQPQDDPTNPGDTPGPGKKP